jgi:hypothetical protein
LSKVLRGFGFATLVLAVGLGMFMMAQTLKIERASPDQPLQATGQVLLARDHAKIFYVRPSELKYFNGRMAIFCVSTAFLGVVLLGLSEGFRRRSA